MGVGIRTLVGALVLAAAAAGAVRGQELRIQPAQTCGGSILCNGGSPFDLTSFTTLTPLMFGGSPKFWLLKNDTGLTLTDFSLTMTGTVQNGPAGGVPDFACSATAIFSPNTCTINDVLAGPGHPKYVFPSNTGVVGVFEWFVPVGGAGLAPDANFVLGYQSPGAYDDLELYQLYQTPEPPPTVTPEPATLMLLGTGLALVAARARKRLRAGGTPAA